MSVRGMRGLRAIRCPLCMETWLQTASRGFPFDSSACNHMNDVTCGMMLQGKHTQSSWTTSDSQSADEGSDDHSFGGVFGLEEELGFLLSPGRGGCGRCSRNEAGVLMRYAADICVDCWHRVLARIVDHEAHGIGEGADGRGSDAAELMRETGALTPDLRDLVVGWGESGNEEGSPGGEGHDPE